MNVIKEWRKKSGIYKISHQDLSYIGSSVNLYDRISQHISSLRSNKHHSHLMQNYFNKHGEETFVVEILEYCEKDITLLRTKEKDYIIKNKCKFNSTLPIIYEHSEEMKLKIANTMKKMWQENPSLNPRLGAGHKLWIYDFMGNLIAEDTTTEQAVNLLGLSNRSVINNGIRKNSPISCKKFIILKDNNWDTLINWINYRKGLDIPMYKLFKDGSVKICTTISKTRVRDKVLNSENFSYYSAKNKCFYTFIGLIEKCRLREEIPQIITAELSKKGENPNLN